MIHIRLSFKTSAPRNKHSRTSEEIRLNPKSMWQAHIANIIFFSAFQHTVGNAGCTGDLIIFTCFPFSTYYVLYWLLRVLLKWSIISPSCSCMFTIGASKDWFPTLRARRQRQTRKDQFFDILQWKKPLHQ